MTGEGGLKLTRRWGQEKVKTIGRYVGRRERIRGPRPELLTEKKGAKGKGEKKRLRL